MHDIGTEYNKQEYDSVCVINKHRPKIYYVLYIFSICMYIIKGTLTSER